MIKNIPKISNQINHDEVHDTMFKNYEEISIFWINHQLEWVNGAYQSFNDHDKFLIIIYLIKRTLDFYQRNFVKLNYDETYAKDRIEVEKFNVIEIAKTLKIPKESARRKVIELEKAGVIIKKSKSIIIDRSAFKYVKPEKSIIRTSRFLSKFSLILTKNKILKKSFTSEEIKQAIENNFSYVWKLYYELQIPMLISWKQNFDDLTTWHIYGVCAANHMNNITKKALNEKSLNEKSLDEFYKKYFTEKKKDNIGLNAMSISDISGIPRATVVRKLNNLLKSKHLIIDENKRYLPSGVASNKESIKETHSKIIKNLTIFASGVYNILLLNNDEKKYETPFYLKSL